MAPRSSRRVRRSSRPAAKKPAPRYLTNPKGERRAIILGMDYYLRLLSELNTLRALVKQHRLLPARVMGRKARRPVSR